MTEENTTLDTSTDTALDSNSIPPVGASNEDTSISSGKNGGIFPFHQMMAQKNLENQTNTLNFLCLFTAGITFAGFVGLLINEHVYGEYWKSILDLSSKVVFMLIGFVGGQKYGEK